MKKKLTFLFTSLLIILFSISPSNSLAAKKSPAIYKKKLSSKKNLDSNLLKEFKKNLNKSEIAILQKRALKMAGKAIPSLIEVMKNSKYPDKSRWLATFLVGRVMGKSGAPFISKFLKHPNWILRMASLKTLLALKQKRYGNEYAKALRDQSFIVRKQALDNIRKLSLTKHAGHVWSMLYDKKNYYTNKKGKKRTNLIKEAIKTIGELKFEKAKKPLLAMVQKKKYADIFSEMDYSLSLITGKKSPKGKRDSKKRYWKKIEIMNKTI